MKKQKSRPIEEYNTTTNRSVYNKLHKQLLEKKGKILCSWCAYHENENYEGKYYGETGSWNRRNEKPTFRYPNWKLVTKKKKQWMIGGFRKKVKHSNYFPDYLKFEF